MIIGIGITGVFISTLAAGLTRLRIQKRSDQLGYETKQTIKSKIDGLEELSEADIRVLLSMIKSLHDSLQKSKSNLKHHIEYTYDIKVICFLCFIAFITTPIKSTIIVWKYLIKDNNDLLDTVILVPFLLCFNYDDILDFWILSGILSDVAI